MLSKVEVMTMPEIFRRNNFNRCRHCGQYFERDEQYYFVIMNGSKLKNKVHSFCKYEIENFYIHKNCYEKYYKNLCETENFFELEKLVFYLFNKSYPRAKYKYTKKQLEKIEKIKSNCIKKRYAYKDKTKYIYILGEERNIKVKGKYNKIDMIFEAAEKGFNIYWLLQKGYLDMLLK